MKIGSLLVCILMFVGCGSVAPKPNGSHSISKCDRLQIWQDVLISGAVAHQVSVVVKHETGRDVYDDVYLEKLTPTLKRYGIDRSEAFQNLPKRRWMALQFC